MTILKKNKKKQKTLQLESIAPNIYMFDRHYVKKIVCKTSLFTFVGFRPPSLSAPKLSLVVDKVITGSASEVDQILAVLSSEDVITHLLSRLH